MRRKIFTLSSGRRGTEIHVLVPLGDAEWNALVEFILPEPLGRSVHYANQFVIVPVLFVEQRGGMFGIEAKGGLKPILIVGEVINLLRNVGKEYLVTVI